MNEAFDAATLLLRIMLYVGIRSVSGVLHKATKNQGRERREMDHEQGLGEYNRVGWLGRRDYKIWSRLQVVRGFLAPWDSKHAGVQGARLFFFFFQWLMR